MALHLVPKNNSALGFVAPNISSNEESLCAAMESGTTGRIFNALDEWVGVLMQGRPTAAQHTLRTDAYAVLQKCLERRVSPIDVCMELRELFASRDLSDS